MFSWHSFPHATVLHPIRDIPSGQAPQCCISKRCETFKAVLLTPSPRCFCAGSIITSRNYTATLLSFLPARKTGRCKWVSSLGKWVLCRQSSLETRISIFLDTFSFLKKGMIRNWFRCHQEIHKKLKLAKNVKHIFFFYIKHHQSLITELSRAILHHELQILGLVFQITLCVLFIVSYERMGKIILTIKIGDVKFPHSKECQNISKIFIISLYMQRVLSL